MAKVIFSGKKKLLAFLATIIVAGGAQVARARGVPITEDVVQAIIGLAMAYIGTEGIVDVTRARMNGNSYPQPNTII